MKHRKLRIAWSVAWGVVAVLLVVLWVRSYWHWDNLGTTKTPSMHSVVSLDGRVIYFTELFVSPNNDQDHRDWYFLAQASAPMSPISFPSYLGFYVEFRLVRWAVSMPYWFLAAVTIALAVIPWVQWRLRFRLRTLLIATTLVAVVLGIIVWMSRAG